YLEHMVLKDIAERAGLFVKRAPPFNPQALSNGELDVVDGIAVPYTFEHRVAEAEYEDVLDRLLAKVVVDAKDMGFVEELMDCVRKCYRAAKVVPERLFHDEMRPIDQSRLREPFDRRPERRRRHREVHEPVGHRAAAPYPFVALFPS